MPIKNLFTIYYENFMKFKNFYMLLIKYLDLSA